MFFSFAILVALPLHAVRKDAVGDEGGLVRRTIEIDSAGTTNVTVSVEGDQTCCCNQAAPLGPEYLCYDKKNNEVFTTASTAKAPKGATTLTYTPMILTTSKCASKGEAVLEANAVLKLADQKEISLLKKLTEDNVILEAHVQKVGHWAKYAFPEDKKTIKKMFAKYSSTNMAEQFSDVHIDLNGIVYGPHDTQKSVSDSLHGVPVCTKWQKAARTFVRGHKPGGRVTGAMNAMKSKPSFDIKDQKFSFSTECSEEYTCLEYKIGHACGFDHEDIIYLKAKGRSDGACEEGKKCPSGSFQDKGNCKVTGTCKYYFCDCRNDSPDQCASR